ncbi:hypothetical protein IJJ02_02460 [Candidatus Saccharibacteria bacterium]|nr:hypothetical protein [Candidatus Saccharibacteria bacterium]
MRTKQQNMKKKLNTKPRCRFIMTILLGLSAIAGLVLSSTHNLPNTSALSYESEQGVAFTFNPTVTISITGGTGATNDGLTITNLTPGDVKDSNIITVSASANTPLGYSLSSTVGSSTYNTTELRKDGTSTANKFTNLSTNKASLSNFDDNTWGYSYSTDSGSTWISGDITSTTATGYNGLPIYTTSSPIKLINSSTAGSSSIQFKIGAKASTSQIAGIYNNVINFIGTGKVVTTEYKVYYNDPSGEATTMPTPNPLQGTDTTGNAAVKISSTVPVRDGYMFKGWCTSQTTNDTCSSDVVQPGGLVALNPGTSSTTATVNKTIYAMWESNLMMQNLDPSKCTTTATTVVDNRDGKEYLVQRLADGKCWMTTNLNLAGGTALSADDTDVTSAYISSFTTSNNLTKSGNTIVLPPSTTDSGFDQNDYSYVANSGNASSDCSSAPGCYSYYSWDAATLGSGRTLATDNTDAEQSICPKGWHLPNTRTGTDDTSDFRKLMIALGGSSSIQNYTSSTTPTGATMSSALQASPNSIIFNGGYANGSFRDGGSVGYYWSSASKNTDSARNFRFDSSSVASAYSSGRKVGFSVRCVLGS